MSPRDTLRRARRNDTMANALARVGALVSLGLSTLVVARIGGPAAVGVYALMRVLPGLTGVLVSAGLPGATTYFLAGPTRESPSLRLTILGMAVVGGLVGTFGWIASTQVVSQLFFPDLHSGLVALAGLTVFTQLQVATAKSCSQGTDDLPGANRVIVLEEFMFLPAFGALWLAGVRGYPGMIGGLLIADILTTTLAYGRLARRGFFRALGPPSLRLAKQVAWFGSRAQVGGILSLLNLRFDFLLLDALAGAGVLGIYAIASKFAELLKVLPMALTYVLYPRYARDGLAAAEKARRLLARAGVWTAAAAVPLWVAASLFLPVIYGRQFDSAIGPAHILLIGLATEGVAGVITAFLYGVGRPGLNSVGMAAGVIVTVVLDLLLIPRFGATGAAVASSAAYATSTAALVGFFWMLTRSRRLTGDAGTANVKLVPEVVEV